MSCIFCDIVSGKIKADIVYQDEHVVCFSDLKPQAPVHLLIVPRRHVETVQDADRESAAELGRLLAAVPEIARMKKIDGSGYRLVINAKKDAGQEVMHVHVHLLGGRKFGWPPG